MNYANDIVYRLNGGVCQIKSLFRYSRVQRGLDMPCQQDGNEFGRNEELPIALPHRKATIGGALS